MELNLTLTIVKTENIGQITDEMKQQMADVFVPLIESGALTGLRNGSANLHFDHQGVFQGIQFDYWPWRKRKN